MRFVKIWQNACMPYLNVCEITELCPGYTPNGDDDDDGCESSPTADAGLDQEFQICDTEDVVSVDFTGSGTGFGTLSYAWDLDDDTFFDDSLINNPQGVAFGEGVHTVTLKVTDECNNSAIDEAIVTVTMCINTAPYLSTDFPSRQAVSAESVSGSCVPTYELTLSGHFSDDEGDNLSYSLVGVAGVDYPTGMTLVGEKIVWDPYCVSIGSRCHECGYICFTIRVQDDGCCEPLYTDVEICVEVWNGMIDDGTYVGIGFDNCPIDKDFCN